MALTFTNKKAIVEKLQSQIEMKDSTAINTLMLIYNHQTQDEQQQETVKYHNKIGFKPQDAKFGTSLAIFYQKHGKLSAKQIEWVKKIVKKYARQVVDTKLCTGEIRKIGNEYIWGFKPYCQE